MCANYLSLRKIWIFCKRCPFDSVHLAERCHQTASKRRRKNPQWINKLLDQCCVRSAAGRLQGISAPRRVRTGQQAPGCANFWPMRGTLPVPVSPYNSASSRSRILRTRGFGWFSGRSFIRNPKKKKSNGNSSQSHVNPSPKLLPSEAQK